MKWKEISKSKYLQLDLYKERKIKGYTTKMSCIKKEWITMPAFRKWKYEGKFLFPKWKFAGVVEILGIGMNLFD